MKNKLLQLQSDFLKALENISNQEDLKELESKYLWKKWLLKDILAGIKDLNNEDKKIIWVESNKLKNIILKEIKEKIQILEKEKFEKIVTNETIDVTAEFPSKSLGHKHPISIATELLEDIFISLGFKIEDGPEIETEEFNTDTIYHKRNMRQRR